MSLCQHEHRRITFFFGNTFTILVDNEDARMKPQEQNAHTIRDGQVEIACRDCSWKIHDQLSQALYSPRMGEWVRSALAQTLRPYCDHKRHDLYTHRLGGKRAITVMHCPDCQGYIVQQGVTNG